MEALSERSGPRPPSPDPSIADLNIFAPRSGSSFRGRLWATDPSLMSLEEAAALVAEAPRLISWVSAIQAGAVERVREGIAEAALASRDGQPERLSGEVAHALAVTEVATLQETSEAAAARLVNVAHELSSTHVAVMEAVESGDITEPHARAIVDQAASLPEEAREAYGIAALNACRTRTGRLRTPAEFRRAARDLREKMHPESIQARRKAAAQERGVWNRPEDDGMVSLTALLPAETGMALYRRIDSLARSQHRVPDEHRTLSQLRADVWLHLGLNGVVRVSDTAARPPMEGGRGTPPGGEVVPAPASSGGVVARRTDALGATDAEAAALASDIAVPEEFVGSVKAEIVVHLPASALLGSTGGTGYLDGYGVIDAQSARELAAAAPTWHRLYTDTDGTPLRLGRTTYRPPEGMRRFLRYRDGTCVFPGCTRPAESSELDHTHEWQDGGGTDADNLAHLCRKHHALKSLALIEARQASARTAVGGQYAEPTGTVVWTTMLSYARTTTPADRDRLLGYYVDGTPDDDPEPAPKSPDAMRPTDPEDTANRMDTPDTMDAADTMGAANGMDTANGMNTPSVTPTPQMAEPEQPPPF